MWRLTPASIHFDHADAVVDVDLRSVFRGQVLNTPQDALRGALLYHCGPVMLKQGERWMVQAAGPTTSIREEPYQGDLIRRFGIRAVMGKGGMGKKTASALRESGAVYLNAIGGAAQYYARCMRRVDGVRISVISTKPCMSASNELTESE